MRKDTAMKMFAVMAVLAIAIVGVFFLRDLKQDIFEWQYVIIDSTDMANAQETGAISQKTYYQINFEDRQVRKCRDERSVPGIDLEHSQVVYQTEFDERTSEKLKLFLEKLWQTGTEPQDGIANYYAVGMNGEGERTVSGSSDISQLKTYTDKFNKLGAATLSE